MPHELTSTGHCTAGHLFKLQKTNNLRLFHPYTGHPMYRAWRHWSSTGALATVLSALVLHAFLLIGLLHSSAGAQTLATPSRSTTIALTSDETRLVVINREANTVSIIQVKDAQGNDIAEKLAEIAVGLDPRCVAIHPNDEAAYVTNGLTADVSVISLTDLREVGRVRAGTEPRGCALTPNGDLLYVANHTEGTVSIIITSNALSPILDGAVQVGRNPTAIAITNDGDGDDADETVFVTQIFAELDPNFVDPFNLGGEVRDLGKLGVVQAFPAGNATPPITKITLSPLANSGFFASRSNFCPSAHPAHQANQVFCPDPNLPATDPVNANNEQGVFANQLLSAVIRGNRLYVTAIGAQPEPPEKFDVNVQALVYAVDTEALVEVGVDNQNKNLNKQIDDAEKVALPPPSLDRTFGNDIVAIDANLAGDTFLIVSRGGNYVFRGKLADPVTGELNILNAAGTAVDCRAQTGNLPSGVAMRQDGTRAYANNEANFSVTSLNVDDGFCLTLQLDIPSSEPPAPGTLEHAQLVGKLAFFTALGIPDNDIFGTPIRDFIPRDFKGKQSKDAWSSCGSCHPDGLADGVTWSFGTGPRQTKPLDGMFSKTTNMSDVGILNWSAVRGSNTDFNANSRVTQGGCGFASDDFDPGQCFAKGNMTIANPAIYDHGITQGGSEALDAQTLWIFFAVRALNQPQLGNLGAGAAVFDANCASCHGGAKWTKSQIFHRDNPAAIAQNGAPLDPGVTRLAPTLNIPSVPVNEFFSFTCNDLTFQYLNDIGTFDVDNPLELRDNATGSTAFGVNGFNSPSLLSINYHAPYLHRGQAQTLEAVFPLHGLGAGASGFPPTTTIATELTAAQQLDLLAFLKSIDGTTTHLRSAGDEFRDDLRMQGTCPPPTQINDEFAEPLKKSQATDPTPVVGGAAGTFTLVEEFCNDGPNKLTLLQSVTATLTGGNILLNRDGGTDPGVGSVLTFPSSEGFADRILDPGECVAVTYKIGLATPDPFEFFVDVVGNIVEPAPTAQPQIVAQATGGLENKKRDKGSFRLARGGS
jgi:DNA-binding beta-propeller fold protein YncE